MARNYNNTFYILVVVSLALGSLGCTSSSDNTTISRTSTATDSTDTAVTTSSTTTSTADTTDTTTTSSSSTSDETKVALSGVTAVDLGWGDQYATTFEIKGNVLVQGNSYSFQVWNTLNPTDLGENTVIQEKSVRLEIQTQCQGQLTSSPCTQLVISVVYISVGDDSTLIHTQYAALLNVKSTGETELSKSKTYTDKNLELYEICLDLL